MGPRTLAGIAWTLPAQITSGSLRWGGQEQQSCLSIGLHAAKACRQKSLSAEDVRRTEPACKKTFFQRVLQSTWVILWRMKPTGGCQLQAVPYDQHLLLEECAGQVSYTIVVMHVSSREAGVGCLRNLPA